MTVRPTMTSIIKRLRVLVNDPGGVDATFDDQTLQDILDDSRLDIGNVALTAYPTYSGSSMQYLDYYADMGDWEDDVVLKQFLTRVVTPATSENIVGHWTFAVNTMPPVYITGKSFDLYHAAADVLERWAAKWVLSYSFSSYGQTFSRAQAAKALTSLAKTYRQKQRPVVITATRSDLAGAGKGQKVGLEPRDIDYYSTG